MLSADRPVKFPPLRHFPAVLNMIIYIVAVTLGTFTGGAWASLGIGGGLVMFFTTWWRERQRPKIQPEVMLFVLGTLVIIALLNVQAAYPGVSWHMLIQQASIMIPLALLFSPQVQKQIDHPHFFLFVTLAALTGATALGLEFALGLPFLHLLKGREAELTEYNRGISYLVIFSFPLMGYLWTSHRRWSVVVFMLILLFPVFLTESRATKMAWMLGSATTLLGSFYPKLVRRILFVGLIVLSALPFFVTYVFLHHHNWVTELPPSWHHRFEIWDYMSYRIFERPWLGWGIGSSHLLPYQEPHGTLYSIVTMKAGHPHNAIIELWVETGLPGLILGLLFALCMLRKISQFPSVLAPFAWGAWMAALTISMVAYNFWDDSQFSVFAMTALAFIFLEKTVDTAKSRDRPAALGIKE